jgi:hypothetical protein
VFAKLANTVVVMLTAVCSGLNGAPLDRIVDESTQWNTFDSHLDGRSIVGSEAVTARRSARLARRKQGGPMDDAWGFTSPRTDDELPQYDRLSDTTPRTSFGAGSTALSALGHSASTYSPRA